MALNTKHSISSTIISGGCGISGASGLGRLGTLIVILLFSSAVWAFFQVAPFFYYSQEIQGFMESYAAKASVFSDYQIRKALMEKIKDLELPIEDKEDLKIYRANGKIIIELEYQEIFYLSFGDKEYTLYVFDFHPKAEHDL